MTELAFNPPRDRRSESHAAARSLARGMLWLALATSTIVPHSFQLVEGALLLATAGLCLIVMRRDDWFNKILLTYFIGVFVTAVYIWVGYANGAPRSASLQTIYIYIVSPMTWIVMSTVIIQLFGLERTVKLLIGFTWAALLSVAAFFYAFLVFGRQAVLFLTDAANVNISGGFAGANILVYGSLIFLVGGAFAQPSMITRRWARFVLPAGLVLCVITSGRSALALAVPIGFLTGLVLRSRISASYERMSLGRAVVVPTILLSVAITAVIVGVGFLLNTVQLGVIFESFFNKVVSGGGDVRTEQAAALWEGFLDTYGIGAGHGVGVSYIRNTDYPWRYEIIPLATLFRVGVVGTLAYASTFIVYGVVFMRRASARALRPEDVYMVGGFLAAAAAAWTNPYIESFVFQWMFFLPVMSLAVRPTIAGLGVGLGAATGGTIAASKP